MEYGPVPPHERSWRHPSELAAEQRELLRTETAPLSVRFLALATGALSLAMVGALVMSVTPQQTASPVAISATTTPAAELSSLSGSSAFGSSGAAPSSGSIATSGLAPVRQAIGAISTAVEALATPIGTGRFAFVTKTAAGNNPEQPFVVRLPSGSLSTGWAINQISDAFIVELGDTEPGWPIARNRPAADEMVTVMQSPVVTIAFGDIHTLDIAEGTAVIDENGALVAICSRDRERTRLIDVTDESLEATTDEP